MFGVDCVLLTDLFILFFNENAKIFDVLHWQQKAVYLSTTEIS